jgi:hypothetical protein
MSTLKRKRSARLQPAPAAAARDSDSDSSFNSDACDEIAQQPRPVNTKFNTISVLLEALRKAKHVVAIVGAGISVSCG